MATLVTRIQDLATRIATQCKGISTSIGSLPALTTTQKTSLVGAINELDAAIDAAVAAAGAQIDDAAVTSATKTWSINKVKVELQAQKDAILGGAGAAFDTLQELAAALGSDGNFAATINTALAKRVRFDAVQTLTGPEKIQALSNIGGVSTSEIGNPDTDFVVTFNAGLI
jgi:hypothetical protein